MTIRHSGSEDTEGNGNFTESRVNATAVRVNGHLSSNIVDMVPPSEEGTIFVDDILPQILGGPVASNQGVSLIKILHQMPLFNSETLDIQLKDIEKRAALLRPQFSKRTPHILPPPPKPASHPLPLTDGVTIVEQFLQLGERCQWTTQKSDHIWFYQRALQEHVYHTLLRVEPLFDLTMLTRLFKNKDRNQSAGVCSHALMDEVVVMICKTIKKAKYPDTTEEKFMFNAVNILDRQYQAKFCASVEVTLRPYKGRDPYGHMAQHFREVFSAFF